MSVESKELLIREVMDTCPGGEGIRRTESIEVKVIWPDAKPENESTKQTCSYVHYGDWRIVQKCVPPENKEQGYKIVNATCLAIDDRERWCAILEKEEDVYNDRPKIITEFVVKATPDTEFDMPMSIGSNGMISWEGFNAEILGEVHDIPAGCASLPKGTAFNVFVDPENGSITIDNVCYDAGNKNDRVIVAHINRGVLKEVKKIIGGEPNE